MQVTTIRKLFTPVLFASTFSFGSVATDAFAEVRSSKYFLQAYSQVIEKNFQGEKVVARKFADGDFVGTYRITESVFSFKKPRMTFDEARAVCFALGADMSLAEFTKVPDGLAATMKYTAMSGAKIELKGRPDAFHEVIVSTYWD